MFTGVISQLIGLVLNIQRSESKDPVNKIIVLFTFIKHMFGFKNDIRMT